jgi:two-component system sensor histidine kinase/response regulator
LAISMTFIAVLTGDTEWFYISIALVTMGASAMMPWGIGWQAALNLIALLTAIIEALITPDRFALPHWLLVSVALGLSQMGTMLRERHRHQIEAARLDALAASKAKSEFLSSMSHEIRTPMNAVLGMAELLLDTEPSSDQRRYLDVMISNGNSLLELINGILDLARIESGRLQLEKTEFDLAELIDNTISTFGVGAHARGLELITRIAPGVSEHLIGDPLRLRQILINLIGNAMKFTERGEIVLEVSEDPKSTEPGVLRFAVSDTGIGIPAGKLDTIFASFTQADSSTTRQYGGTGLGLAIVKQLVRMMGGYIWVESEVNRGSRFSFTARFGIAAQVLSPTPYATIGVADLRILVVDDNHINRLIVREMLSAYGAEVMEAGSGVEALQAVRLAAESNQPFKFILLDMRMPEMDGLEVARRIREQKLPTNPLIVMLSSDDFKPQFPQLREYGLDAYLVKPITRGRLFEALHRASGGIEQGNQGSEPRSSSGQSHKNAAPTQISRLLVVDDSPDNRLLIDAYLRKEPYQVDYAVDGKTAVRKFIANDYDMVFMDVQMPEMDGLSATRAIRQWERKRNRVRRPIVALSASALEEDVKRAVEAGCDLHLSKPVKKQVLLQTILEIARESSSRRATPVSIDSNPNVS